MPRTIRFHLDENRHHAIAEGLRRRGVDVTTTADAGLLSTSDEVQAAHCLAVGRVIVTQDRDFLRLSPCLGWPDRSRDVSPYFLGQPDRIGPKSVVTMLVGIA